MENPTGRNISVVICAYTEERWKDLVEAVESARSQTLPPLEIIVVIDHNTPLADKSKMYLSNVIVIENQESKGAGSSRNMGVAKSSGDYIAFLDDDAVAEPEWLERLMEKCSEKNAVGVGGKINPIWLTQRPKWFPEEFYWVIGATYKGMPKETTPVRNVWTGNLLVRKEYFEALGGFRDGFGKVGDRACPEDTDFCIRALKLKPQGYWIFTPAAIVGHKVPHARSQLKYYLRRCYNEGWGKAQLSSLVGINHGTSEEKRHAIVTLPKGIVQGFKDAIFRRELTGLSRSSAIMVGFCSAVSGYFIGFSRIQIKKLNKRPYSL